MPGTSTVAAPPVFAPSAVLPSAVPPAVAAPTRVDEADVTPYLASDGPAPAGWASAPSDAPQFAEPTTSAPPGAPQYVESATTAPAPTPVQPQPQPSQPWSFNDPFLLQVERDAVAHALQLNPDGSQTWSETIQGPGASHMSVDVHVTRSRRFRMTGQSFEAGQPLTPEQQAMVQQALAGLEAQRFAGNSPGVQQLPSGIDVVFVDRDASGQPAPSTPEAVPGQQIPPQQ